MHDGYTVDFGLKIKPLEAQSISLMMLKRLLLTKKIRSSAQDSLARIIFDGDLRFLDEDDINGDRTAFCSFPTSGSSLLSKYLETLTGITTGSDLSLLFSLPGHMAGNRGCEITDDNCWFIKSHFPMLTPQAEKFKTNKIFVIVRNPLDVIISLCHLTQTGSSTLKAKEKFHDKHPVFWDSFVKERIRDLKKYY